ncbi:hypothetical protein BAX99_13090 [Elizabethkingia miricola]|nr:hypothetical protein BAX99_13090 [Elizabethkingia miricola]
MKKQKKFRWLINVLIIVAFNTLLIHLIKFEDIIDGQILRIIKQSLILFTCFLFIIIALRLLFHSYNEDVPIPEQKPNEYLFTEDGKMADRLLNLAV